MNVVPKIDFDVIYPYTYDSSNLKGFAELLYIPENKSELIEAVKQCYNNGLPITISGAGTGITGARVPMGGAIISTEKLKSMEILPNLAVKVGAAVTLSELDEFLAGHNLFLPPNPTETNASIGGNVATNASGARTFKYGAMRNFVIGLSIVLPDGDSLTLNRGECYADNYKLNLITENGKSLSINLPHYEMPKVKNASGFFTGPDIDAVDLFVGSEGNLGIFSEIILQVMQKPDNILGGVAFFDNYDKLIDFVINLRETSIVNNKINIEQNDNISARLIEFFDKQSLSLLRVKYAEIPENAVGAIWFEQEYNMQYEEKLMEQWYDLIMSYTKLAEHTWFALNDKDHLKLKEFRHELPLQVYENLTNNNQKKVGLDTAVPDKNFPDLFRYYLNNFPDLKLEYVIFGHIGNSHLHANIFCKNDDEYAKAKLIYDKCIDLALSMSGTVSAEHGIGKLKKPYLEKMYGVGSINEMRNVKKTIDPKLLLNKGTMFDVE